MLAFLGAPVSSEGPSPFDEESTCSSAVVVLIEKEAVCSFHLSCTYKKYIYFLYKENILLISPEAFGVAERI